MTLELVRKGVTFAATQKQIQSNTKSAPGGRVAAHT